MWFRLPPPRQMILIKSLNKLVSSRKEAKEFLGGTNAYNKALRDQNLIFINNEKIIAINDERRIKTNS